MDISHFLQNQIINLNVTIPNTQQQLLIQYVMLLQKWNKVYSLTSVTDVEQIISLHIIDALTLVKYLFSTSSLLNNVQKNIIDIGSGMGIPAIVLAICMPQYKITALDSNKKKTTFLRQVGIELQLTNLYIICERIENYIPKILFDIVTARAVANVQQLINLAQHLINNSGYYLLMKSKKVYEELTTLQSTLKDKTINIIDVSVPNTDLTRFLVKICNKNH